MKVRMFALATAFLTLVGILGSGSAPLAAAAAAQGVYTITDLGTLPHGTFSYGLGINASSQVVGTASTATEDQHAFLWQHGKMTDLGTLPGFIGGYATGINRSGQVVGRTDQIPNTTLLRGFLWQKGKMTDLGTLVDCQAIFDLDSSKRMRLF